MQKLEENCKKLEKTEQIVKKNQDKLQQIVKKKC